MEEQGVNQTENLFNVGQIDEQQNNTYQNQQGEVTNQNYENTINNGCSNVVNNAVTTETTNKNNLPAKISIWKQLKNFLLQDASTDITWTPKQQKVVDFWTQEIPLKKILFSEIKFK